MTVWEQLGIGVTKDIAAIRSAYAAKAKELHPEEHPEEFQQLQKAYKMAVKYAKSTATVVSSVKNEETKPGIVSGQRTEQAQQAVKNGQAPEPFEQLKKERPDEEEQMSGYDYGEIQEETASYLFFQEFFYIAWNPWLLNNQICWDLFLHRPQYKILFEDGDFRKNLVMTMCTLSGWHRNTIRYFDSFFKSFQDGRGTKAETEYFWWKWKKGRFWNKGIVTTEKWITREQKDMQAVLLSTVRKKIGIFPKGKEEEKRFFKDKRAVETYLQIYLEYYAPKNPWKLEKMYQTNRNGKTFARSIFLVLLFWVCLIVFINLTGDKVYGSYK